MNKREGVPPPSKNKKEKGTVEGTFLLFVCIGLYP
jgi:hypothetical protein